MEKDEIVPKIIFIIPYRDRKEDSSFKKSFTMGSDLLYTILEKQ